MQIRLIVSVRCTDVAQATEAQRREGAQAAPSPVSVRPPHKVVREARWVERLAYTRTQAAEALGISRSTLNRLLPFLETVELPRGTKLIPIDELERLLAERRRHGRIRSRPAAPGRPVAFAPEVVERIRTLRATGKGMRQITRDLNATQTPTGREWWPSTIRAILSRQG